MSENMLLCFIYTILSFCLIKLFILFIPFLFIWGFFTSANTIYATTFWQLIKYLKSSLQNLRSMPNTGKGKYPSLHLPLTPNFIKIKWDISSVIDSKLSISRGERGLYIFQLLHRSAYTQKQKMWLSLSDHA